MFRKMFLSIVALTSTALGTPHYYATAADYRFYDDLLNLIGSIQRFDSEKLSEIAVFDLGLTEAELRKLQDIQAVTVYPCELLNPHALDLSLVPCGRDYRSGHRTLIGYFTWKPAVFKKSCELFPYFLYMDAGLSLVSNPDCLFKHITQQGYFLIDSGCPLGGHTTRYVRENLILKKFNSISGFLFDKTTFELSAGLQGLSRNMYDCYILPVCELAKDIRLFDDDNGSAPRGPGFGRNDQTIFSILARSLNLKVHHIGQFDLMVDGAPQEVSIEWDPSKVNSKTIIRVARDPEKKNIEFIKTKNSTVKFKAKPDSDFDAIDEKTKVKLDEIRRAALSTGEALYNTYQVATKCIKENIPGDFVECGVAAGAHPAAMAYACQQLQASRKIHLFDSFQGIPLAGPEDSFQPGIGAKPTAALIAQKEEDFLVSSGIAANSVEQVKIGLNKWGIKQDNLVYHPGWFQHTLPVDHESIPEIAILRLAGILYESTKVCLEYLYPKVTRGGYVIIADYRSLGCKKALHDYLNKHHLRPRIIPLDGDDGFTIYWQVK